MHLSIPSSTDIELGANRFGRNSNRLPLRSSFPVGGRHILNGSFWNGEKILIMAWKFVTHNWKIISGPHQEILQFEVWFCRVFVTIKELAAIRKFSEKSLCIFCRHSRIQICFVKRKRMTVRIDQRDQATGCALVRSTDNKWLVQFYITSQVKEASAVCKMTDHLPSFCFVSSDNNDHHCVVSSKHYGTNSRP